MTPKWLALLECTHACVDAVLAGGLRAAAPHPATSWNYRHCTQVPARAVGVALFHSLNPAPVAPGPVIRFQPRTGAGLAAFAVLSLGTMPAAGGRRSRSAPADR